MCIFVSTCFSGSKKATPNESDNSFTPKTDISQTVKELDNIFNAPEQYHEGVKSYQDGNKYGFIDEQGNIVIPAIYDHVGCFNEGLVSVTIDHKMGYINHSGELVIPAIYDFTNFFSQGVAYACKNGKFGYINKKGETVIDFIYDRAWDFFDADGFAAVRLNGKEGLIDINGNIVMPISFEGASSTSNGVATVYDRHREIKVYNNKSYKIIIY